MVHNQEQSDLPCLFTPKELAARYGCTERGLQDWRGRGWGPRWIKMSKYIRYPLVEVLEWEAANVRDHIDHSSTKHHDAPDEET